ncbi:hypothetical protein HYU11_06445 [Candidatus Woesearchaeota archaeon]|nr:hypothetical protein [Candidatus Woesearchaeota archaeon]
MRKVDFLPYLALFLLAIVFLNSWIIGFNSHTLGDVITYYYPRAVAQQQSIVKFGDFLPLWNPYIFSGDLFLAKGIALNPLLGMLLLFLKPMQALHLNVILAAAFSGIFMYMLSNYLLKNRFAAFISSLVYMFSGFFLLTVVFYGWVVFANAYMLMPLLIFFLFRCNEGIFPNSVFAGIVLGLFIVTGSGIEFLYASVVVGVFLAVNLIGNRLRSRLVNSALIGLVIILVCIGVSAFKLFPIYEYYGSSVRSSLSWEEASGRIIPLSGMFSSLIEPGLPKVHQEPSNKIGIVAFLLAVFGVVMRFRSRAVIFLSAVAAVSLLLASGSFLLYLFWKFYPGWSGMRYANRAIIIFVPVMALLAGYGAASLYSRVKAVLGERKSAYIMVLVSILVFSELAVLGSGGNSNAGDERYKLRDIDEVVSSNILLRNLSRERESSIFRINTFETRGIDWGTEFYTVPMGLENIFGYDTQWMASYLNGYLSAAQYSPAKMWGVLNVKYITSQRPVNVSGFRLVGRFADCNICFPEEPAIQKAWGPYLYENSGFMPRAWIVDSAILVVGDPGPSENIVLQLMLEESFDPGKVVIIRGMSRIDDYSIDELRRYKAVVFVGGALTAHNQELIKGYASQGGIMLPDLSRGKTTASREDIVALFSSVSGSSIPVDDSGIIENSFSSKSVSIVKGGFLVLSERYASVPGWVAFDSRNKYDLMQADGAISAVYVENPSGPINFEYRPRSFFMGSLVTLASLAVIMGYLVFIFIIPRIKPKPGKAHSGI